ARRPERRSQREEQQRAGIASSLVILMNRKLTKKRRRYGIGFVALPRLWQTRSFDLCRAQRHITGDLRTRCIANNVDARHAGGVIGPAVTPKPVVHRIPPAVETVAVIGLCKRPRWRYFCQ